MDQSIWQQIISLVESDKSIFGAFSFQQLEKIIKNRALFDIISGRGFALPDGARACIYGHMDDAISSAKNPLFYAELLDLYFEVEWLNIIPTFIALKEKCAGNPRVYQVNRCDALAKVVMNYHHTQEPETLKDAIALITDCFYKPNPIWTTRITNMGNDEYQITFEYRRVCYDDAAQLCRDTLDVCARRDWCVARGLRTPVAINRAARVWFALVDYTNINLNTSGAVILFSEYR